MPAPTVLLVDTHEDSRAIYAAMLKHHGFAVVATPCFHEGLRLARERVPALVVLEFARDRARTLETVRALRADPATAHVAVVALSTSHAESDREAALRAGFSDYLLKPCPPMQLLDAARRLLNG